MKTMAGTQSYLRSIQGNSPDVTEALQLQIYVEELQRQAEIASRNLTRGWLRAMRPETDTHDPLVWGDLQSALFAAIVIARILKPTGVRAGLRSRAEQRAQRLRELLEIDDDFAVFRVRSVRDSFEHFDERLDATFAAERTSLIDWHISRDGLSFHTPADYDGPKLEALRVFYPRAGTLHFGKDLVDLYAIDSALLYLKNQLAPAAAEQLTARLTGGFHFGASISVHLVDPDLADKRLAEWLRVREQAGRPVAYIAPEPASGL